MYASVEYNPNFEPKTLNDVMSRGRMVPGGETGDKKSEVGLIEYLNWKRNYEESDRSGELGFLFCVAFDINDSDIRSMEDDIMAHGLIKKYYCYDDLVART